MKTPTQADLAALPERARVAFAARWASYVLPALEEFASSFLGPKMAVVPRQALEAAVNFAESASSRMDPADGIMQHTSMCFIAKSAEKEEQAADDRGNKALAYKTHGDWCAAWSVDFAASAAVPGKSVGDLPPGSIGYAAEAMLCRVHARLMTSGASEGLIREELEALEDQISRAIAADLECLRAHSGDAFPQALFGRPPAAFVTLQSDEYRDVPVFVSSSFADMHPERDHLRHVVFPQLEEALKPVGVRPVLVDLRLGVPLAGAEEENKRELQVLQVCLREIDRSSFFLGIVGQRWGTVPSESVIAAVAREAGFTELRPHLSITALEMLYVMGRGPKPFFYFREFGAAPNAAPDAMPKDPAGGMVDALKAEIRQRFPEQVREYPARDAVTGIWDPGSFGPKVYDDLWHAMRAAPPTGFPDRPPQIDYDPQRAADYCKARCGFLGFNLSLNVIRLLCAKGAAIGKPWLDAALQILLCLDEDDYARLAGTSEQLMASIAAELPARLEDLYRLIIERSCRRFAPTFVRELLLVLASSLDGLRESDLARLLEGRWDQLAFANVRRHLGHQIACDRLSRWSLETPQFRTAVADVCSGGEDQTKILAQLGEMYASLPDTDPRRPESINLLYRARATAIAAKLLGEYSEVPVAGIREPSISWLKRFFIDEISREERRSPNPASQWLGELMMVPGLHPIVRFRICDRLFAEILPQLVPWICAETLQGLLRSCWAGLHELLETVPDHPRPIRNLALGSDPEFAHSLGANTPEDADILLLSKESVTKLLEPVCIELGNSLFGSQGFVESIEYLLEAKTISERSGSASRNS